jgi:hypothetical protein
MSRHEGEGGPARHPPHLGATAQGKNPAAANVLTAMLSLCPATLQATAAARCWPSASPVLRRPELVVLQAGDLVETPDGLRVAIRRSKTDQEGQGAEVAILRSCRLRPVEAVQTWLATAEITDGPVFPPVFKGRRVQAVPLSALSAAQIVKAYAERAGLDPVQFAAARRDPGSSPARRASEAVEPGDHQHIAVAERGDGLAQLCSVGLEICTAAGCGREVDSSRNWMGDPLARLTAPASTPAWRQRACPAERR